MQINMYRMLKQEIKYKDIYDLRRLIGIMNSNIFKFMRENDIAEDDIITLDLRLLLEQKNENKNMS